MWLVRRVDVAFFRARLVDLTRLYRAADRPVKT